MASTRLIQLCFDGKAKVKAHGKTFTIRANAYGNWYGYIGTKNVEMFWGDYTEQAQSATAWLDAQTETEETPMTHSQAQVIISNARIHACYQDNSQASVDAEWLLFNARSLVRAEHDGDAVYILCLAEARQKRISLMGKR